MDDDRLCVCQVCNKDFNNILGLSNHIKCHKLTKKDYYDKYLKQDGEGTCKYCGESTRFKTISSGYNLVCHSKECIGKSISYTKQNWTEEKRNHFIKAKKETNITKYGVDCPANYDNRKKARRTKLEKYGDENYTNVNKMVKTKKERYGVLTMNVWDSRRKNISKFEMENNCTSFSKLVGEYGQGWLSLDLPKIYSNKQQCFIENKYLPIIQEYANTNHSGSRSNAEIKICNMIKDLGYDIIENSRKIIPNFELDIYIPKLNIAIEYNGVRWHSLEMGATKDYHLKKSLACREKGIRLIHIYEFEEFEEQLILLKNLISFNIDKYPTNDFNKNNLLEDIPEPEIVYNTDYTIYGVGKLY